MMRQLPAILSMTLIIGGLCAMTFVVRVAQDTQSQWPLLLVGGGPLLLFVGGRRLYKTRRARQRMIATFETIRAEIAAGQHQGYWNVPGHIHTLNFAQRAGVSAVRAHRFLERQAAAVGRHGFLAAQGEDYLTYNFSEIGSHTGRKTS